LRRVLIPAGIAFLIVVVLGAARLLAREVSLRARITPEDPSKTDEVAGVIARRLEVLGKLHGLSRSRLSRAPREGTDADPPDGDGAERPAGGGADSGGGIELRLAGFPMEGLRRLLDTLIEPGRVALHLVATREELAAVPPEERGERFLIATERQSQWSLSKLGHAEVSEERHYLWREPELAVGGLARSDFHTEGFAREAVIELELLPEDGKRFAEVTERHVGRQLALVVDGAVKSAPVVDSPVRDGRVELRGIRDRAAAKRLARLLSAGPLPCVCSVELLGEAE
jgi:hypothetical protein